MGGLEPTTFRSESDNTYHCATEAALFSLFIIMIIIIAGIIIIIFMLFLESVIMYMIKWCHDGSSRHISRIPKFHCWLPCDNHGVGDEIWFGWPRPFHLRSRAHLHVLPSWAFEKYFTAELLKVFSAIFLFS